MTQERPKALPGYTTMFEIEAGHLYLTVSLLDDKPFEIFSFIGKAGNATHGLSEALCRMVSLHLRRETPLQEIHDQLANIKEMSPHWNSSNGESYQVHGVADAIARVLHPYLEEGQHDTGSS